jgi:hypothetical protein
MVQTLGGGQEQGDFRAARDQDKCGYVIRRIAQ